MVTTPYRGSVRYYHYMSFLSKIADAFRDGPEPLHKLQGYLSGREETMLKMNYLNDYDRGRADAYGEVESYLRMLVSEPENLC